MSTSVTDKKQNFFKAITSAQDRDGVLNSLVRAQGLLQLKQEGKKAQGPQDITIVKASARMDDSLVGFFVTGPPLPVCEVTIAFDLAKAMFFCTGALTEVYEGKYVVLFRKIYELQRRDAYRVSIPANLISAKLQVLRVNGKGPEREFRIVDLSAGGLGLTANEEAAGFLPTSSEILGVMKIGTHQPVEVSAKVKYHRKVISEKVPSIHIGCEFFQMTVAMSQKIAFLVNDCHRISFARLSK